jgi:hypothetical protein
MGYRGKSNYDERDRLFQQSMDGKAVNRHEVKKSLDELFKAKPKEQEDRCLKGHTWIRDFDRKQKCAYCKTPRPEAESKFFPGLGPDAGGAAPQA